MIRLARGARALMQRFRYSGPTVDGVRPVRAAAMSAVGLASMAAMFGMVTSNALAVNFTTTDHVFQVYSNYIQGVSAGGFVAQNKGFSAAGQTGVAEIGIETAQLNGLCAIAHETLPGLGAVSLIIKAGAHVWGSFPAASGTSPTFLDGDSQPIPIVNGVMTSDAATINATDLFLNTDNLSGYGNRISGLNLGQNAPDTKQALSNATWPVGQNPPVDGNFGLTADHLNLGYLNGNTYGINLAGSINLPGLVIKVVPGSVGQTACPAS